MAKTVAAIRTIGVLVAIGALVYFVVQCLNDDPGYFDNPQSYEHLDPAADTERSVSFRVWTAYTTALGTTQSPEAACRHAAGTAQATARYHTAMRHVTARQAADIVNQYLAEQHCNIRVDTVAKEKKRHYTIYRCTEAECQPYLKQGVMCGVDTTMPRCATPTR